METNVNKKLFSTLIILVFLLLLVKCNAALAQGYYVEIGTARASLPRSMAGYAKLENRCDLIYPEAVTVSCGDSKFNGNSSPFDISLGRSFYVNSLYSYSIAFWYTENYRSAVNTNVIAEIRGIKENLHIERTASARAAGVSFMPELRLDTKTKAYLNIGAGYGCGMLDVTVPGFEIKNYPVSLHTEKCSPLAKLGVGLSYKMSPAVTITGEYGQMGLPLVQKKYVPYFRVGIRGYFAQ